MNITVLLPTRDRPTNAQRIIESFNKTKRLERTMIQPVLDAQSPLYNDYLQLPDRPLITYATTGGMVKRSNEAALVDAVYSDIIGWVADDNLFVTEGWDEEVVREFETNPGLGCLDTNDLLVGDEKAGAFFVRASCVEALGFLFPPELEHLYADYAVNVLYKDAGAYKYRPDIVIEHLHPYAGKATWDDAYRRYNTQEQDAIDGRAFAEWYAIGRPRDIEKVQKCLQS